MHFKKAFIILLFFFSLVSIGNVSAQTEYQLLAPLPLGNNNTVVEKTDINEYIPAAIRLIIGVAGALAVIYIMVGGIKYLTTDSSGGKGDARATIEHAIFGLLLAIGAFVILYTVNPRLVDNPITITGIEGSNPIDTTTASSTPPGGLNPETIASILNGCVHCVEFQDDGGVNFRLMRAGGCLQGPWECMVNVDTRNKLIALTDALRSGSPFITFQVTESYPPHPIHVMTCQQIGKSDSGTCVDANFRGVSPTVANIARFIEEAESAGLKAQYEVLTEARRNQIIDGSNRNLTRTDVIVVEHATGEHFSVYNCSFRNDC